MKICFALAIEKNYTSAMLHFARYYEQIEYNREEIIRLYTLAYEHGHRDGAYSLALFFKHLNDTPNVLKYLIIVYHLFFFHQIVLMNLFLFMTTQIIKVSLFQHKTQIQTLF
jgi:TPR repeat protein